MKPAGVLTIILCFVAVAQCQGQNPCQYCSDSYNACNNNAYQLLNNCLNFVENNYGCLSCADSGCPNVSTSTYCQGVHATDKCCQDYSQAQSACYSDFDSATLTCQQTYADCLSTCPVMVGSFRNQRRLPRRPSKAVNDAAWALLMRNLSRPSRLKLPA
jgi:hypothetical protein